MNIPINDNITSGILNLIYQENTDSFKSLNILNISNDVSRSYTQLKNKYPNSSIYNIEMDISKSENIDNIKNTILGNIKNPVLDYEKSFFDYILLDDTMQKFVNTQQFLKNLSPLLKGCGSLLCGIPNIMHLDALYSIITGHFSYKDSGILSKDNLRFFTLNSAQSAIVSSGYNLLSITSVATEATAESKSIVDILKQFQTKT